MLRDRRNIINFKSEKHKQFYYQQLNKSKSKDTYHQSLFYTLGIDNDCREHIVELFDFEKDCIMKKGLRGGWQTSGSDSTTRLAFNLWNGFVQDGFENESTPYELFACEHAPYFFEAMVLE